VDFLKRNKDRTAVTVAMAAALQAVLSAGQTLTGEDNRFQAE